MEVLISCAPLALAEPSTPISFFYIQVPTISSLDININILMSKELMWGPSLLKYINVAEPPAR